MNSKQLFLVVFFFFQLMNFLEMEFLPSGLSLLNKLNSASDVMNNFFNFIYRFSSSNLRNSLSNFCIKSKRHILSIRLLTVLYQYPSKRPSGLRDDIQLEIIGNFDSIFIFCFLLIKYKLNRWTELESFFFWLSRHEDRS